jgi:hypothetical protein
MDMFDLDLSPFGAKDYILRDRLDMTGHSSGNVDPHINTDIVNPYGNPVRGQFRDLSNDQLPGFNGMQTGW